VALARYRSLARVHRTGRSFRLGQDDDSRSPRFSTRSGRLVNDKEVTHLPPEKRNIGMGSSPTRYFEHDGAGELEFGLLVRKVGAAERHRRVRCRRSTRADRATAKRRIRRFPRSQQRGRRACGCVPAGYCCSMNRYRRSMQKSGRNCARAGLLRQFKITAVYVTHDQEEAMALGEQVVVMDNGKIMQSGTPYQIYASPKNDFVAKFIGTANLYDAEVHPSTNGSLDVRFGFGTVSVSEALARRRWPALTAGRDCWPAAARDDVYPGRPMPPSR
jgi:ABC-type Fe3+/spermidine/putrescine transport system ATPase subunit